MHHGTSGLPVHHQLPKFTQTHVHWVGAVMPSNHLILCHPLLILPSIFPSIRVFSNKSVFHIRWPKYWSFSFSVSPSNGYSGLISFRMDWLDLLVVQGTLKIMYLLKFYPVWLCWKLKLNLLYPLCLTFWDWGCTWESATFSSNSHAPLISLLPPLVLTWTKFLSWDEMGNCLYSLVSMSLLLVIIKSDCT